VVVAHASPVRASDGSVLAVVTTLSDVTERLDLEQERARLRDRIAEDARFLEAVADELRSGLGAQRVEQVVQELRDRAART
jgi:hypothetical protein